MYNFGKKDKGGKAGKNEKKQAEKDQVYEEFEGKSLDDIKQSFIDDLEVS